MYNFAILLRRTPPPTFSDTSITDRHSDTTIFQLRVYWVRISWSIGSDKIVRTCAAGGSRTLDFLRERRPPYPLGQALRLFILLFTMLAFKSFLTSRQVHPNHLDKSISSFRGSRCPLSSFIVFCIEFLLANSVDPVQTPRFAASEMGLHCLHNRYTQNTQYLEKMQ